MLRQLVFVTLFTSTIALPAYSDAVNPDPTVSPNPVVRPKLPDFLPPENPGLIQDDRSDRPAPSKAISKMAIPKIVVSNILQDIQ